MLPTHVSSACDESASTTHAQPQLALSSPKTYLNLPSSTPHPYQLIYSLKTRYTPTYSSFNLRRALNLTAMGRILTDRALVEPTTSQIADSHSPMTMDEPQ